MTHQVYTEKEIQSKWSLDKF